MDRIAGVPDRHITEALLVKMALEGKDYRRAKAELEENLPSEEPQAKAQVPPPRVDAPASLAVDIVEIQHVEVSLSTPDVQFHAEATRIMAVQLRAGMAQGAPPGQRDDPLLVDLDGDGAETTGGKGARDFDLKGDGRADPTSFVTGGDAFLALDRDGDGAITSGKELFGDQHGAVDGFAELAKFDGNRDARIDTEDAVYGELRLWDGRNLRTLKEAGITAIALAPDRSSQELSNGDAVIASGTAAAQGRTVKVYAMALQTFGGTDELG